MTARGVAAPLFYLSHPLDLATKLVLSRPAEATPVSRFLQCSDRAGGGLERSAVRGRARIGVVRVARRTTAWWISRSLAVIVVITTVPPPATTTTTGTGTGMKRLKRLDQSERLQPLHCVRVRVPCSVFVFVVLLLLLLRLPRKYEI